MKKITFVWMILLTTLSKSDDMTNKYWKLINEKADKIYGGYNYELSLKAENSYFAEKKCEKNESEIGVIFNIPILSKSSRIDKKIKKIEFLEKGAKYIEIIENNSKQILVFKEKEVFLKDNIKEYGIDGVNGYYECKSETVKLEAEIESAKREIEAMLK